MSRIAGTCRCGQVRYQVTGEPVITMACHCTGCQQMTSSAYSLSSLYLSSAFELLAGEPVIGGLHGPTPHYFCDYCKSWLYTPWGDTHVNVRATLLQNAAQFSPFIECCTKEQLPWASTGAEHAFHEFPDESDYARLVPLFAGKQ